MERFILSLLYRTAINSDQSSEGEQKLAYGTPFLYFVYALWLCVVGFLMLGIFVDRPDTQRELIVGICALVGFCLLILSMHLEFSKISIKYDDDGIRTTSPWRRARHIPWCEISSVQYVPSWQWYEIKTQNNGTVRCHVYLSGLRMFLDELERRGYSSSGAQQKANC